MKLKKHYLRVIRDLGNYSQDLVLFTDWCDNGFSEAAYLEWQRSVSRFLRVLLKHNPDDLVIK